MRSDRQTLLAENSVLNATVVRLQSSGVDPLTRSAEFGRGSAADGAAVQAVSEPLSQPDEPSVDDGRSQAPQLRLETVTIVSRAVV